MSVRDHINYIESLLQAEGYPTFFVEVTGEETSLEYPYVLIWGPAWGTPEDVSLDRSDSEDFAIPVHFTCVAQNPYDALDVAKIVRQTLNRRTHQIGAYQARLTYERSDFVGTDKQVVMPDTNRHPAYAVESYRLESIHQ